jgi:hypothetical protein
MATKVKNQVCVKNFPYEVRLVDGVLYLFYEGKKLPGQVDIIIKQNYQYAASNACKVILTVNANISVSG